MKDDFIVDDDFEEEDDEDDEEGSLTDMPKNKRTNKKANTVPPKTPGRSKAPIAFSTSDTEDDIVYTNDMELEEEEYEPPILDPILRRQYILERMREIELWEREIV